MAMDSKTSVRCAPTGCKGSLSDAEMNIVPSSLKKGDVLKLRLIPLTQGDL